jgi:pyruvate/2-oxoglutarate/acetoin dehydrogenase E1 component
MTERILTYAEAIREAIGQAMETDENVFMLGEDIGIYGGAFGVSGDLYQRFGKDRILDTPISELGIVGAAVGAALVGMKPIVEIQFSDFTAQAMDQIVNQAAKIHFMLGGELSVPLVLRAPSGSGTGAAALSELRGLVCPCAGAKGSYAVKPLRGQGFATGSSGRSKPSYFPRAQAFV